MRRRRKFVPRQKKKLHKTNEEITSREVRLVGENITDGIYPTTEAIRMAKELELDLIEISGSAKPPVCRVLDYKKFLYEKKKKDKEIKAKTHKTVLKEIRFTPNTDEHDFDFKAKHAQKFLKEGSKVKAYVHFRGRNILFKDRGELLLLKLVQRLEEFGTIEQMPKLEGKRMFVFIAPKKIPKKK